MVHSTKTVARSLVIILASLKFDPETTRILKVQLEHQRQRMRAEGQPREQEG